REAFASTIPERTFVETLAGKTQESTINSLDAATILFAHSMVDGAAFDYCRVTALHAPEDWESDLLNKQVPLNIVRKESYEKIRDDKLRQALVDLEMESLRKKIDRLHARCQPPDKWSPMTGYMFDP